MKLCHTGDGFWNEGTGRLQTGGLLRQQSLGDQPQAKLGCKTSAAMTRVTLRANAKEDDRRRMTAPEALPCLHRSYCLVIATFRVWQRLWRHFWTHERSLSLNLFVFGCPASLLLREAAPLRLRPLPCGRSAGSGAGLSRCRPWAYLLLSKWDLPGPDGACVPCLLAGRFLTTGPPGYPPWKYPLLT